MSKEFLAQLLRSENRSTSASNQGCDVCLQQYGTISAETGSIECPICLPCSHVIGSVCIAKWLGTNNTCPMCRREFFPAQLREPDSDDPDDSEEGLEVDDENTSIIIEACYDMGRSLRMSSNIYHSVTRMAIKVYAIIQPQSRSVRCTAAITIFMISHIMNAVQPLEEISRVSSFATSHLREVYRILLPHRDRFIPDDLPAELLRNIGSMDRFLAFWPAPTPENGFAVEEDVYLAADDVEMQDVGEGKNDQPCKESPDASQEFCETFCIELGYDIAIIEISQRIAGKIHDHYLQDSRGYARRTAAVSVLVASHLAGVHTSVDFQVSVEFMCSVVGGREITLCEDYATIYGWRREITDEDMLESIGTYDIKRALQAVPPLAWPAL